MNFAVILAAAAVAAVAGAYMMGLRAGEARTEAQAGRERALVAAAAASASEAAASAIAGIRVEQRTIRQEVQREIVERPVYRDCEHPPGVVQRLDAALAGTGSGRPRPGADGVPAAPASAP